MAYISLLKLKDSEETVLKLIKPVNKQGTDEGLWSNILSIQFRWAYLKHQELFSGAEADLATLITILVGEQIPGISEELLEKLVDIKLKHFELPLKKWLKDMAFGTIEVWNEINSKWVNHSFGEDLGKLSIAKMIIVYEQDDEFPNIEIAKFNEFKGKYAHISVGEDVATNGIEKYKLSKVNDNLYTQEDLQEEEEEEEVENEEINEVVEEKEQEAKEEVVLLKFRFEVN